MQIKVINPNTTTSMTQKIGAVARAVAAPGTEIITCNPSIEPVAIEGHYDEAISREVEGVDGYVIACFGDPGLLAARELAKGPVIGIAEAAMHTASFVATGFSIVTTMSRTWIIGMSRFCRNICAVDLPVLALEAEGSSARKIITQACRQALIEDRAGAIVLGCSGMADLTIQIGQEIGVPVIDGVSAAVKFVEALVNLGLGTSKIGDLAFPITKPYKGVL